MFNPNLKEKRSSDLEIARSFLNEIKVESGSHPDSTTEQKGAVETAKASPLYFCSNHIQTYKIIY